MLSVQLFGQFLLRRGHEAPVPLESGRAESLLAFLLLHRDRAQPRQHVAFLLWPDSTETQALTNLRHVLHTLRRTLPELDRHLEVTTRTMRWRDDQPYRLDVGAFEDALAGGSWQDAVEAYAGDLLAGRTDEWVQEERARLRRRYLDALDRLVAESQERGDLTGAVRYAERLMREEPLREGTYLALMRLHDARGDRARAVRVYHECAATLERELGVEPAAAIRAAYDALLAREDGREPAGARLGGPPFVGRAAERAALTAAWRRAQAGRAQVLLLTGEPGIGKTRLAEEFRAWCAHRGALTAVARAYAGEGRSRTGRWRPGSARRS
jgi:DNA-binding SARP family transcriptional activator